MILVNYLYFFGYFLICQETIEIIIYENNTTDYIDILSKDFVTSHLERLYYLVNVLYDEEWRMLGKLS